MPGSSRRRLACLITAAALVTGALLASARVASATAPVTRPTDGHVVGIGAPKAAPARAARAQQALQRARRALSASTPAALRPDPTMALSHLWRLRDALPPRDRAAAERLSERPASDSVDCSSTVACIHWTAGSVDPAWPATVRDVVTHVGTTYQAAGYRAPLPDGSLGGTSAFDVYLAPLAGNLAGYCSSDQPQPTAPGRHDQWKFCVLNSLDATSIYKLPQLQAAAAVLVFFATEDAYDGWEDDWFRYASAIWAQAAVYPDSRDVYRFLDPSPITRPNRPLDTNQPLVFAEGAWTFLRYLTEKFTSADAGMATLVRDAWGYADSAGGRDRNAYALQAVDLALRDRGSSLAREFALYSEATRRSRTTFTEGQSQHFPVKPLSATHRMTAREPATSSSVRLMHMASATFRLTSAQTGRSRKLVLFIDMAPRDEGTAAVISTWRGEGAVRTRLVRLSRSGDALLTVGFSHARVKAVEVTLVNTSWARPSCRRSSLACDGAPVVDHQAERVVARLA